MSGRNSLDLQRVAERESNPAELGLGCAHEVKSADNGIQALVDFPCLFENLFDSGM
jgi:hypothetical protein